MDWDDNVSDMSDEVNRVYVSNDDLAEAEISLANSAFLHRITIRGTKFSLEKVMHATIADATSYFHGIKIDNGSNKKSIMKLEQYTQYCPKFGINESIGLSDKRGVRVIGVYKRSVATAAIQITFKDLGI